MPVVPVTQQTEHRVKEQSLKHKSPLSGADDFTLLVESDSKTKEIIEELLDVQGLIATAVGMPAKAAGLQDIGVWDSATVWEKAEVAAQARQSGIKVRFGQLTSPASSSMSCEAPSKTKRAHRVQGRLCKR